jgi:hypothetical protein
MMGDNITKSKGTKVATALVGPESASISRGITELGGKQSKKIAENLGYVHTSQKKQAVNSKIAAENAAIEQEKKAAKEKEEDIRRRTAIFQSVGGPVSVGGRKAIFSN